MKKGTGNGTGVLMVVAALAAIAGASSDAQAKGQNAGTACVKVGSNGTLSYTTDGAVANVHTSQTLTVDCPVDWPEEVGGTFDSTATGAFEVVDSSPAAITCTLRAERRGSGNVSSSGGTSVGNANAYTSVILPAVQVESALNSQGGGVHLTCTIPPVESGTNEASFLVSYHLE